MMCVCVGVCGGGYRHFSPQTNSWPALKSGALHRAAAGMPATGRVGFLNKNGGDVLDKYGASSQDNWDLLNMT